MERACSFPYFRFHRRFHSQPDAVCPAGNLAEDFWFCSASRPEPRPYFSQWPRLHRRDFRRFLGLALVLVIIKSAGGQPVWAAQFTNPYFVLFMSAIVLVFALNLFGVFEINLPQ